jgi:hypothetical protein
MFVHVYVSSGNIIKKNKRVDFPFPLIDINKGGKWMSLQTVNVRYSFIKNLETITFTRLNELPEQDQELLSDLLVGFYRKAKIQAGDVLLNKKFGSNRTQQLQLVLKNRVPISQI